ncbi:MAG: cation transporter [Eubacteriales bacterium]|nr:cation transporter [Eubacteriales bacterium]
MKETADIYKRQFELSLIGFIVGILTLVLLTVSAVVTGSVLVWMKLLDTLCFLIRVGSVAVLSRKLTGDLTYEYNYGVQRIEALLALFCDGLLCLGLVAVAVASVLELFHPSAPSELLYYTVILEGVKVLVGVWLFWQEGKLRKRRNTPIVHSEYTGCFKDAALDAAAFVLLLLCYELRAEPASWILAPGAALVIAVIFWIVCAKNFRRGVRDLTDRTLDEEKQMILVRLLGKYADRFELLEAVNSHTIGERIYVDLAVTFAPGTTYGQICDLQRDMERELKREWGECCISLVIGQKKGLQPNGESTAEEETRRGGAG